MRILHLTSECAPWAKSGGLGDVLGALPDALNRAEDGVQAATVMPLYRRAKTAIAERGLTLSQTGIVADVQLGDVTAQVRFLRLDRRGSVVFFAANDAAFDRDGLYGYDDDGMRFILFCKAVVGVGPKLMGGVPDVVHCHDWHAALAAALIRTNARHLYPGTRTFLTLHNLAYQGVFSKELVPVSGLGWEHFHMDCAEYHDRLNLLKAGIALADVVTTVSPTYAREVKTPAFGANLDGLMRKVPVHGILNGIDTEEWDPENDPHVQGSWNADDLSGKQQARAALLEQCEWEDRPGQPLLAVVSRMTGQKGLDLITAIVPELHHLGARLVVLGTGEPGLEEAFRAAARIYTQNVRTSTTFNVPLSHAIIAGADMILLPSRFEPCGLTQLYGMRMGSVPVVHATGGLADTVRDPGDAALARGEGTGFAFAHPTVQGLRWALGRAVRMYRKHPEAWAAVQRAGMRSDWSWERSARTYLDLYRRR